jgi:hypothetical protein
MQLLHISCEFLFAFYFPMMFTKVHTSKTDLSNGEREANAIWYSLCAIRVIVPFAKVFMQR